MNDSLKRCWNCEDFKGLNNPWLSNMGQGQCLRYGHVIEFTTLKNFHSIKCVKPFRLSKKKQKLLKPEPDLPISQLVRLNDTPVSDEKITSKIFENMESEVIE